MKCKLWPSLLLLAVTLCSAALANTTWYVDGVHGNDNNNCKSPQTACKTIGHAISSCHLRLRPHRRIAMLFDKRATIFRP